MKEILIATIPSLFTLVGVVITVRLNHEDTKAKIQEQTDLTIYRINQLEKKQDKHNGLIERMYEAEKNIEVMDEQIKVANHRIEDLEHDKTA